MSKDKVKMQVDTDHEPSGRIPMPMNPVAAELHPKFYFDDGLVIIKVENTLFRVHKFQLAKSETFSDMFKMPKGPAEELEEGASPEHPIALSGVKAPDFEALLTVLYTFYFTDEKPKCEPEVIVPAFRLAHMWNFSHLRTHLLPLVKNALGCVDKIVLARELGIQEWLAPAHIELCQRAESLTMEEGTKLGMHSTIMITRLREKFRPAQTVPGSGRDGIYCSSCIGVSHHSGERYCQQCKGYTYPYYRYTNTTASPGAIPPGGDDEIEDQVTKWVEGGCITV